MPKSITRLLQEIAAAQDTGESADISREIESLESNELAIEHLIDAFREARERLSGNAADRARQQTHPMRDERTDNENGNE